MSVQAAPTPRPSAAPRDDDVGGARAHGHGFVGPADRLAALDDHRRVVSPADGGTLVGADLPLHG